MGRSFTPPPNQPFSPAAQLLQPNRREALETLAHRIDLDSG
jgi:hypothetical protein